LSTPNEIANEARAIETAPAVSPGAEPQPLITAELIRNLAALVADLAGQVERIDARA
jgi:hypothetical protein